MGRWAPAVNGARRALGVSPVEPELGLSPLPAAGRGFRDEEGQVRSLCPPESFSWILIAGYPGSSGKQPPKSHSHPVHPGAAIPGSL